MRKKAICGLAAAAVLAAVSFSGCGGGKGGYDKLLDKNNPVTIKIWHYYNGVQQTQFDEMVSEFNDTVGRDKGIYVEAYSKNSVSELADSVLASVNKDPGAETAPDIFGTYVETAYQIDKLGKLADLNAYFTDEEKAEYVEEYIAEGVFGADGSMKIFPTAKSTEVMILNLTDWEDFAAAKGVAYDDMATWEGLARVAEEYYNYTDALTPDVENDGRAFFGRDSMANYMIIGAKQLGHPFADADKDGNVNIGADKDTVKKLWDSFYVPYVKGYYASEGRFRSDDVKTGTVIALICSTTGAAYYPSEVTVGDEDAYPISNIVLKVPNFEGTEPYAVQQGAGMSVIRSNEKKEYASAVFLKWFTEEERNIRFSVHSGYLPVKKTANDIEKISGGAASKISDTMLGTLGIAIEEIGEYELYTSPPFDKSAETRDFIGEFIERTAKDDRAAAWERIEAGEARDKVFEEYTSDAAFDAWYDTFEKGLDSVSK